MSNLPKTRVLIVERDHSEADFTGGICPDCKRKLYPEFYGEDDRG